MNEKQVKIALGGMLHDIGKILYRYNDGRNHSTSGYEFLKEQGISDEDILDQVRYHHSNMIKGADIADDSLAYITYWADNVAASVDRRNKEEPEKHIYDKFMPLESIFNVLNNNDQKYTYDMARVYDSGELNYPSESAGQYSEEIYGRIYKQLSEGLKQIELDERYVNSLLGVLEANMSFVPSSTDKAQLADISLFDHSKITAAVGNCIYEYLEEQGISSYKHALFENAAEYYMKKCFLMFSMDISGIQDFIYTVHSEGALKMLRSKSFYLEMMLEHIIDILIDRIGVSRANLIYSGGGHAYMLLPATEKVKNLIDEFEKELNDWYIDNFRTALYIACGYAECSANDLRNEPDGSYKDIFMNVSRVLSAKKASRYSAEQIIRLNDITAGDHERECKVCGRVDHLVKEDLCEFCSSLKELSSYVLDKDFVTILSSAPDDMNSVPMPLGYHMIMESEKELRERLKTDESYVRSYSKNKMFTGYNVSTRLWTGSYCNGSSFEDLADKSEGIRRIGVLRADVDNLGTAFVRGFERSNGSQQYVSISRTATFSRKLNMFFKLHINYLLGSAKYSMQPEATPYSQRSALIVYSGGDDLFIVGAWNELIEAAVDINDALKKYTQGTLTLSAGIGIFPQKYPVKALARQTGELEDASKQVDGKDAISLFEPEKHTYKWEVFKKNVIDEKYILIEKYFSGMQDKGMSAMYKLMGYIRNLDDKINLARLAYMLGRMEPDRNAGQDIKDLYGEFSRGLYKWVSDDKDSESRRELLTAIYLYVYLHRDNGR